MIRICTDIHQRRKATRMPNQENMATGRARRHRKTRDRVGIQKTHVKKKNVTAHRVGVQTTHRVGGQKGFKKKRL